MNGVSTQRIVYIGGVLIFSLLLNIDGINYIM